MTSTLPLPHSPLSHFLGSTKARLAQHEDLEDAVYLLTPPCPTLDQVVAAIAYAYLQTQLQKSQPPSTSSSSSSKVYIPVVQAKRAETLDAALPDLSLALQASLIGLEDLTFLDDQEWRTATAYGRNKDAILVGGTSTLAATAESINEWEEVHGMQVVGLIDTELPPTPLAGLKTVIIAPTSEVKGTDPETGLASLVALHFKAALQASQLPTASETEAGTAQQLLPEELADFFLAAILVESDNLTESKTSYLDQGAVGFLAPKSSFQQPQADEEDADDDDKSREDGSREEVASTYVPNFPDLDSFYRALRSVPRGGAAARTLGGLKAHGAPATARLPTHFEWSLIRGNLLPAVAEAETVPDFAKKAITGDFAAILTSPIALKLLRPYGAALGKAAAAASSQDGSGTDTIDLFRVSIGETVAAQLVSSATSAGEVLCIAMAALHAFIQVNWTGPDLATDMTPYSLLRSSASDAFPPRKVEEEELEKEARRIGRIIHRASLDALVFKGEPAYHLCQVPFFLVFAKAVFETLWTQQQQQAASAADGEGDATSAVARFESLPWWRLRASTVHSHVLDEPASFGPAIFEPVARLVETLESNRQSYDLASSTTLPAQESKEKNPWASLSARLTLERGVALQRLGNDREASEEFVEAAKVNGLRYRLGGALGKRTKYQKDAKIQLVLLAKSAVVDGGKDEEAGEAEEASASGEAKSADAAAPGAEEGLDDGWQAKANPHEQVSGMPNTYALNDDLLLEQTQFTSTSIDEQQGGAEGVGHDELSQLDPNSQPALAVLDQCTLLALCLNIRNTQPTHGLTSNQMSSFISRVISHPRNWTVHTMSLLLRARLESTRTRTVERSVLQLQALIDQMPTNDSSLQERLKCFHALDLPPKWKMQAELARRYASLGVTRSALEIFERIEMWEDVVQCLGLLGRQQEGIEIIRELLQGSKVEADVDVNRRKRLGLAANDSTAQQVMFGRLDRARESKLWCILGDLEPTAAESNYTQAWSVSRHSSARAARSLGGFHFARNDHAEAAKWLRSALKINPLYTRSWFVLGCSYLRLERFKEAATCFRRCTALDEEDGESWNNLASCYLRMSEAQDAVEVETMGQSGRNPALLDADYDDEDDFEEDKWSLPSDGEELSDRSDSGVELSSTDESGSETETEVDTETEGGGEYAQRAAMRSLGTNQRRTLQASTRSRASGAGPSYNLKLLAHRSLGKALKFSHDNWRVWYNYMIVSIDVGMLGDAMTAMARTVEIRTRQTSMGEAAKEAAVDMDVLKRLVDVVTRGTPPYKTDAAGAGAKGEEREAARPNSNEGQGLYRQVRRLFDETLLTRISSSPAIYTEYGRLLEWTGENSKAVSAYLNAYRSGAGNPADDTISNDLSAFKAACGVVEKIVGILLRLGPKSANEQEKEAGKKAMEDATYQARSIVRTFVARTKEEFEDEDDWVRLKEMLAELR